MLTADDVIKTIIELGFLVAKIYFLMWTVKSIENLKKSLNFQKERVNQLYRDRDEDLKKILQLQMKVEELEK